jgi:hypothetical protein
VKLNLTAVDPVFHAETVRAFEEGKLGRFFIGVGNHNWLALVSDNLFALKDRGIYEKCLLDALIMPRINNRQWSMSTLVFFLAQADRAKLRAAGSPPPRTDNLVIYRGVAGTGGARRVRGLSWTRSLTVASWFAIRCGLPVPAVFTTEIATADAFAFYDGRNEQEVIVIPEECRRIRLTPDELRAESDRHARANLTPAPPPPLALRQGRKSGCSTPSTLPHRQSPLSHRCPAPHRHAASRVGTGIGDVDGAGTVGTAAACPSLASPFGSSLTPPRR